MRLLYVIDSLAPGGAETSLVDLAPGLAARGIELHVLPLGNRLDLSPQLQQAGATVHARGSDTGRLGSIRAVMEVARLVVPDLVHTTLYEADITGRAGALLSHIPSSTSLVGESYGPSHYAEVKAMKLRAAQSLDIATARLARRFHAVSRTVAESAAARLHIPRDRIDVIPRGRDPLKFGFRPKGLRDSLRDALGIRNETPLILAVGRLDPAKGLDTLIASLSVVSVTNPSALVLIAGADGRSASILRARAAAAPLEVRFLGHRNDVPSLLAAADVLCFPSEREGSPGTIIEAMAVGCPIVASDIPPVRELVGAPGDTATLLVPARDARALGHALNVVLEDSKNVHAAQVRGRRRFEDRYTTDATSRRMADFFHMVTERPYLSSGVDND